MSGKGSRIHVTESSATARLVFSTVSSTGGFAGDGTGVGVGVGVGVGKGGGAGVPSPEGTGCATQGGTGAPKSGVPSRFQVNCCARAVRPAQD